VDRFSELVNMKDKRIVKGGGAHLIPGHLDDPQKTFSPTGLKVAGVLTGL